MKISKYLFPFIIVSIIHLIADGAAMETVAQVSKPFLMISLLWYFHKSLPASPVSKLVTAGLSLSLLGDTALIFQESNSLFFMAGLACFLFAHISYTWLNFNLVHDDVRKFSISWKDLPFIVVGFAVFLLIKDGVGDLKIPVLSYIVVICIMGIMARQRWQRSDKESFWLIMSGAILFMISDSILAINKFMEPLPSSGFWIMLTYIGAQFLIVEGVIRFMQKIRPEAGS